MAIRSRTVQNELIFHCFASSIRALGSDRGVQYANNKLTNVLNSSKVTRSMSRTGNCWDNAVAESFFKSLKTELIYGNNLISKEQMKLQFVDQSVSELAKHYIELYFNHKRRHSPLNYMTIKKFNNQSKNYKIVA